jgi:hypothetical protein
MLTPLAVIAGLLIAFLASRVWSNVDRANTYIAQEASAIRESVVLADTLPADTGHGTHRFKGVPSIHRDGRLASNGTEWREFAADTSRSPGCDEGAIRRADPIDNCVRAPQSACIYCRQLNRFFNLGGMLSRASHGSRSASASIDTDIARAPNQA